MAINESDISQHLDLGKPEQPRKKWFIGGAIAVAVVVLGLLFNPFSSDGDGAVRYKTTKVERGDLKLTVTATGTLQPVSQVDVGSELSGTIDSVDVDFNDHVKVGSVLAKLDTSTLESRIVEGRASLQSAEAKVQEAKATELEKKTALRRCKELAVRKMCSENDVDAAAAAYDRAKAGVASARAQVSIAKAVLDGYETNLDKATVRSPIEGIVLDRKVEPGQTVAASLQTPVLFTLAEDLTKMELIVAVDEADIGQISDGMKAEFSVDAYPERRFKATITQIRHAPQTVDGVVTYETVLAVDNPDQLLLPGMTATADISTRHIQDALLIPNAAFRYSPPVQQKSQEGGSLFSRMFRRPHFGREGQSAAEGKERKVWVLQDGKPVPFEITVGASDGLHTEVVKGQLKPGMALITDSETSGS